MAKERFGPANKKLIFGLIFKAITLMVRKLIVVCCMAAGLMGTTAALAQDAKPAKTRPDIPGSFMVEFGFNQPLSVPDTMNLGFWGSRTMNVYYLYDIRILKSKFSFHPGIGVGLERYKFTDNRTLVYADGEDLVGMTPGREGTRKSMLVANYFDIPLEFRFSTNPEDPVRSFRASIGGRAGVLYSSFTKVKYKEDGETKKFKDRQNWNLEKIRYSVFAKVGVGNFSVFGYYNLTPVFQKDKGPSGTDMSNLTIGISLSSF